MYGLFAGIHYYILRLYIRLDLLVNMLTFHIDVLAHVLYRQIHNVAAVVKTRQHSVPVAAVSDNNSGGRQWQNTTINIGHRI